MKKIYLILSTLLIALLLTGCGKKDEKLEQYKSDMETFNDNVAAQLEAINNINVESDGRIEEFLSYMDEINKEFIWMADLDVPTQFSNVEELADEASSNMSKAVSLYHQAYDTPEGYDEQILDAALEYYNRAFKRIEFIGTIFQGELPDDDSVTIIHEDDESDEGKEPSQETGGALEGTDNVPSTEEGTE